MSFCCNQSDVKWKREKIPDHKFDYVDVDEFVDYSFSRRFNYSMVFVYTLKSVLTYMAEVVNVILLVLSYTINFAATPQQEKDNAKETSFTKQIPFAVQLTCIAASVVISYILLAIDWRKSYLIVQSRDISYAFTSTVAYRYYVIRSYPHFCFFEKINNSKKLKDVLAYWVYFRLKGWKRLLLADAPRQFFVASTLYDIANQALTNNKKEKTFVNYFLVFGEIKETPVVLAYYALASLTVLIWLFTFISMLIAAVVYMFLLCSIRGNLKEYCVHKIDKRIDELLKRTSRKRIKEAREAELAELEKHRGFVDSRGELRALPPLGLKQGPRLPNVQLEDDYTMYGSEYAGSELGSTSHRGAYYANEFPYRHPQQQPSHLYGYQGSEYGEGSQYPFHNPQATTSAVYGHTQALGSTTEMMADYYGRGPEYVTLESSRSGGSRPAHQDSGDRSNYGGYHYAMNPRPDGHF